MQYIHLIAINHHHSADVIKEYLDIALVSRSYDIPTAIFLHNSVVNKLLQRSEVVFEQTFNMIAEFDISLFTNQEPKALLYKQSLQVSSLSDLQKQSKHHFIF